MGSMTRRGFLKAIRALSGALAVSGAGFAAIDPRLPRPPRLFEWQWELFDYGQQLGVCASLVGPDGIKYRHAVRMELPLLDVARRHIPHADLPAAYPKQFRVCREGLAMWAMDKERKWAA